MIVLAIDTATTFGGVAVYNDATGQLSECRVGGLTRQFSESVIEMMDLCLKNLALKMENVGCLAVASGPGSFTGLRVGLSTVKGLAFATGKPVVTVSTLLSHAWIFPFYGGYVCPVLDARKKEVYSAVYKWDKDDFRIILEGGAYTLDKVLNYIDRPTVFVGDGVKLYSSKIQIALGENACLAPAGMTGGIPSIVARLGAKKAAKGGFADPVSLVPEYFRKSEAESGRPKGR